MIILKVNHEFLIFIIFVLMYLIMHFYSVILNHGFHHQLAKNKPAPAFRWMGVTRCCHYSCYVERAFQFFIL